MGAIIAGENGVELVLVVADRRASADFAFGAGETVPAWLNKTDDFVATLEPVVGAPQMAVERARAGVWIQPAAALIRRLRAERIEVRGLPKQMPPAATGVTVHDKNM